MRNKLFIAIIVLLSACQEENTVSQYEQLQIDIKKIDDYLAANPPADTALLITDASGIRLVIAEVGTGAIPPNPENNLKVSYVGRLFSNDNIFDSNEAFFLNLSNNIIDGWKIGLSMLTEGAEATLYIPSYYAYGTKGNNGIPGNAILKFDIKMLLVEPTSEQEEQLSSQVAAIDLALENVENVIEHPSGIRIVHAGEGTGATPTLYDQVAIKYSGRLLADDTEFLALTERAPSVSFSSRLVNYLHGQIIGMQLMKAGGKATIYVPAILAYGPVAVTNIPANSNLIYEIELLQVIE
jgi:FKBP-type peptidyl-prolyl cis-trans isomerase